MEWNTLQAKVDGLNINDFVSDELLDKLRNEFDDKDIDIVTLQIAVRDRIKDSKNDAKVELISLANHNVEDTLLNKTIVDATSEKNFEKIKKLINDF